MFSRQSKSQKVSVTLATCALLFGHTLLAHSASCTNALSGTCSTPAPLSSSQSSPVAPLSTLSSVVPELQTVEPLMTGVVSTVAPMASVSEPSVTNVVSGGMVTIAVAGRGPWESSLGCLS